MGFSRQRTTMMGMGAIGLMSGGWLAPETVAMAEKHKTTFAPLEPTEADIRALEAAEQKRQRKRGKRQISQLSTQVEHD